MKQAMSDRKPYLLRAMYQWITENGCTPNLVVAHPGAGWVCGVPQSFLEEEFLVLNISPSAAPDCVIEERSVYFSARFGGQPYSVAVLMPAIASIFARETQEGMRFEVPDDLSDGPKKPATATEADNPASARAEQEKTKHNRRTHLKRVK